MMLVSAMKRRRLTRGVAWTAGSKPKRRRGMTLLEVLLAISLLAMLGMLGYTSLNMTMRAQGKAKRLQERFHSSRLMLSRMKRELSMAFVSLHQSEDQRTKTLFSGESDTITFTTSAHEPVHRNAHQSDQMVVKYEIDTVDGQTVVIRRAKYHIDDSPEDDLNAEIAAVGVERLEFDYYDEDSEDWSSDWDVSIDDAEEKRVQLKAVRALADQTKTAVAGKFTGAAADIANVVGGAAVDKAADEQQEDLFDGLFLPTRVKIRVVITDGDPDDPKEYVLETQAEIHMREPLWY